MPDQDLRAIVRTVEGELEHLEELEREMASIGAADSSILRRARGSILHDFYNCCERIFRTMTLPLRHAFRNIYGFELRGDRVVYLSGRFPAVAGRFRREVSAFLDLLRTQATDRSQPPPRTP